MTGTVLYWLIIGLLGIHIATYTNVIQTSTGEKDTVTPQTFNIAVSLNSDTFKLFAQQNILPRLSRPDLMAAWLAHIGSCAQTIADTSSAGVLGSIQGAGTQESTSALPEMNGIGRFFPERSLPPVEL